MKICFLASASSIHTVRWVNAMAERGHKVYLITMHPVKENTINEEIKIFHLPFKGDSGYYLNAFKLKKLLKDISPELLHVHYASGYGTLGRLSKFKPQILSVWGSDVYLYPYRNKFNKYIIKKNLKAATLIGSTSNDMKLQTLSLIPQENKIHVTPFGIDSKLFKPIKNQRDSNIIKIGIVKTLEEVYGIRYLLEAMKIVLENISSLSYIKKSIQLEIVGSGSERDFLVQYSIDLGIYDYVTFTERIRNSDVPLKLNSFDIYCAPSLAESFGVAVIEASACEIPVVVTSVGGLKEVVLHGKTGLVVKSKDVEGLANALIKLIKDDKLRIELGENGREFILKHYEWNNNVDLMEQKYKECLKM